MGASAEVQRATRWSRMEPGEVAGRSCDGVAATGARTSDGTGKPRIHVFGLWRCLGLVSEENT